MMYPIPSGVVPHTEGLRSFGYVYPNVDFETENSGAVIGYAPDNVSMITKYLSTKLATKNYDLEIERRDSSSPLFSIKSFEELNLSPTLLKGVYAMGFNSPSRIQGFALPALIANPPLNLIAQSQNGTGKTAAFLLASLSRVDPTIKTPQVLILSPTYELAIQTGAIAEKMATFIEGITFVYAVKGKRIERGTTINTQIVIGTPGKILDWTLRYKALDFSTLKVFVLDEADVMISMSGHHDQSIRIHKLIPKTCQMLLFSATYTEEVIKFAELIIPDPIIVRLKREEETLKNIRQYYIMCTDSQAKFDAISNLYGVLIIGQSIIFCHSKIKAVWLANKMREQGHSVGLLTGELTIEERLEVLTRFRKSDERVLITTNVCARGIDIQQVTLVVNFDMPIKVDGSADCESYLHRIGRCGRFGKYGYAINMIDGPKSQAVLKEIEEHFQNRIPKLDADDCDELQKISNC